MSSWKEKLLNMDMELENNVDNLFIQSTEAKGKDIGLINPTSGTGVLAREDGRVEAFADYGLGFRMDPKTQSFSIFAPNLKMFYQKKEEISYNQKLNFIQGEYKTVLDKLTEDGE
ncbi:hypothetical protein [Virgibacillus salexigens]|uniref:Uncharacterized protein n=1 Tax=Virgibacillus massiliensis TaxID=1462526 RepID=A0A024QH14_9BACI|nr:hypothetical protein [Virgibacillus massiliensis]CDQ41804.1 hypothetical protein BN990_04181 [Virgibacillus massiliensis]